MASQIPQNRLPRTNTLPLSLQKKLGLKKKSAPSPQISEPVTTGDTVSISQAPITPVSRKQARPGSDMDVMVRDLERTGALPKETKPDRPVPREGSDMATMLADIDKAKNRLEHTEVHVGANGTLALLEEPQPSAKLATPVRSKPDDSGEQTDNALSGGGVAIEGVEHAGNSGAEALGAVGEIAEQSAQVASQSVKGEITDAIGEVAEQGAQVATQSASSLANTALDTALQVGAVASGGLFAALAFRGVKVFQEGIKEGDLDKKLEGGNSVAIGVRSLATSATLANMGGAGSPLLGQVANVASVAAPVLGVGTAAVDGILGVRDIKKGRKLDGALRIGFAISVGAAAVGAGPLATVAAGGFLAARVGRKIKEVRGQIKQRKNSAAASPVPSDPRVSRS